MPDTYYKLTLIELHPSQGLLLAPPYLKYWKEIRML